MTWENLLKRNRGEKRNPYEECEICSRETTGVKAIRNVDPERHEWYKSQRTLNVPDTPYSRRWVRMCKECNERIGEEMKEKEKRGEFRPLTEVPQSRQYTGND